MLFLQTIFLNKCEIPLLVVNPKKEKEKWTEERH